MDHAHWAQTSFAVSIASRLAYMEGALAWAEKALADLGVDGDPRADIALALREALANAIRHGHHEDPRRTVSAALELRDGCVEVRVLDHGPGFDVGTVRARAMHPDLLSTGGRGVLLMDHLMDEVSFERPPGGGWRVVMRRRLRGAASARDHTTPA